MKVICGTEFTPLVLYSLPSALLRWTDGYGSLKERQEQLKEVHAAQVRALQDEHRRQQEELLQVRRHGGIIERTIIRFY